jgi:hypothetical protein
MAFKDLIEKAKIEKAKLADPLLNAAAKNVGSMLTEAEERVRKETQKLTKASPANPVPDRTEKLDPNPGSAKENENTGGLKVQPKIAQGVGSSVQPGPLNASPKENTDITAEQVERAQPQPSLTPGPKPKHEVPELKPK